MVVQKDLQWIFSGQELFSYTSMKFESNPSAARFMLLPFLANIRLLVYDLKISSSVSLPIKNSILSPFNLSDSLI